MLDKIKYFTHICPGCGASLLATYSNVGCVVINLIDSEYNLIDSCANCGYHFDSERLEKLAEKIEKELKND